MALPMTAAPSTPAAMGSPMPGPLAWACCVDAKVPVAATATSARAAILVLIDMTISILLNTAVVVRMPSWSGAFGDRFEGNRPIWFQDGVAVGLSHVESCSDEEFSGGKRWRCISG